jgi:predicted polyphosphate/ATP-dependent NAD kinase
VKRVGFLVNPLAGIGGRVALKGSDGADVVRRALALGAVPVSPARAAMALAGLLPRGDGVELLTAPGAMGEDEARGLGLTPVVVGTERAGGTTAEDTRLAARTSPAATAPPATSATRWAAIRSAWASPRG